MNRNVIYILILVVLIVGVVVSAASRRPIAEMTPKETTMEVVPTVEGSMMKKGGSYIPFTKDILATMSSGRRVLFFYASWCPSCIPADADFEKNVSQLPGDVTLIRVNYNDPDTDQTEKDLAKLYGITYQHTFVQIDADGKEVAKWNGGQMTELLANIK